MVELERVVDVRTGAAVSATAVVAVHPHWAAGDATAREGLDAELAQLVDPNS